MKKKSSMPLLEAHIRHNVRMATEYARVTIMKAREYVVRDKNGKMVRKYKKGPKIPKFRYNIDRGK